MAMVHNKYRTQHVVQELGLHLEVILATIKVVIGFVNKAKQNKTKPNQTIPPQVSAKASHISKHNIQ